MHERIRFIDYRGKKILLVDLSNCPVNQVEEVVRKVPDRGCFDAGNQNGPTGDYSGVIPAIPVKVGGP